MPMPEIEPDGALGIADTACSYEIQVRQASCRSLSFAVCFSRRIGDCSRLCRFLCGFLTPFNAIYKRG
mgnify:CR=1 FL=1